MKRVRFFWLAGLPLLFLFIGMFGCSKDSMLDNGGELHFSTDTLSFDTVFTAQGSFTLPVKIINPQDKRVNISSIRLASGSETYFILNIDGRPGNTASNIELAPNDSVYIFATVNIDPTAADAPFVVEDKIIATLNGRDFELPLLAYGQNAYYVTDSVLSGGGVINWGNDKPYVVIRSALVDEGTTLNISPGARIYMHADSRLYVFGTLLAEGSKTDSIIFQGDRLDRAYFGYEGYPGEWGGLYFNSYSTGNRLRYVVLANGGNSAGNAPPAALHIAADSTSLSAPQVLLDRCIIKNSLGYGIFSYGGSLHMENSLIHSCGSQALAIINGGKVNALNSTIALYGNSKLSHIENPAVIAINYYSDGKSIVDKRDLNAYFQNCIIYGGLEDEFVTDRVDDFAYNLTLKGCFIKAKEDPAFAALDNVVRNQDPQFEDVNKEDYHLKAGAPPIDAAGLIIPSFISTDGKDLDDKTRTAGSGIDAGCYEFQ